MSVYVDEIMAWPRSAQWPFDEVSHLTADTLDELHAFAARLGLRREWFQVTKSGFAHYDLNAGMHWKARRNGARLLSRDEQCERVRASSGRAVSVATSEIPIADLCATTWTYERDGVNHYAVATTPSGCVVTLCVNASTGARDWSVGKEWRDVTAAQAWDCIKWNTQYWRGDAQAIALVTGDWKPAKCDTWAVEAVKPKTTAARGLFVA
jgi:hypothetical protein